MNVPRRWFLKLGGAAIAALAVATLSSAQPQPKPQPQGAAVLIDKLDIKREEVQQFTNAKGAFFGETAQTQDGKQLGRALSWLIRRGEGREIAWHLADVSVGVFRRPSMGIDPLEITFRCTIWSRGYESTMAKDGGCYLEVVLSNKEGLTLNHLPLILGGFDIRCQFKGNNIVLPSVNYLPLTNAVFDEISHIQLFDRGGSAHQDVRYIRAFECGDT